MLRLPGSVLHGVSSSILLQSQRPVGMHLPGARPLQLGQQTGNLALQPLKFLTNQLQRGCKPFAEPQKVRRCFNITFS